MESADTGVSLLEQTAAVARGLLRHFQEEDLRVQELRLAVTQLLVQVERMPPALTADVQRQRQIAMNCARLVLNKTK